ncbi:hypothetical protein M8C21_019608 [Ambrosia artemisiifolia]|uniref:Uncharacterized protein n=1 Tax=Ambrosia artemisiifolia TaxID=4212 RepID=A0AAD5CTQ2_AMBAR|nr:hypothetical protein M8C21_019608 [Ambrosia artemisiifolia]
MMGASKLNTRLRGSRGKAGETNRRACYALSRLWVLGVIDVIVNDTLPVSGR